MQPVILSTDEARRRLVSWQGLARRVLPRGPAGVRALLQRHRCIQLDPLDRIGTNADLVAWARVDGLKKGQVYDALLPGHAFEHFAKERCLLPAELLPAYRARARMAPWWRLTQRLERLDEGIVAAVLAEVAARGPVTAAQLSDQGTVAPLDWSGWKGTAKAAKMALEVLWTRCDVVVCGRTSAGKLYDLPDRALPQVAGRVAAEDTDAALLCDRAHACGLIPDAVGPWWGGLRASRDAGLPDRLIREGALVRVGISGSRRTWLAVPAFLTQEITAPDSRLRILGPLDPLLWDRKLVHQIFGFEYVWEVYKPAEKRRWGWYVVPLLYRGQLVGRMDARIDGGRVVIEQLWQEVPRFPKRALEAAVARLEAQLG